MGKIYTFLLAFALHTNAVASDNSSNIIRPAQLQQDFAQLYNDLKASHYNLFVNVSEREYDEKFAHIQAKLSQPLSKLQARILFQQFVAFGKVAHANVAFPNKAYDDYRASGGKAFPIYVKINDGKWMVSEDYSSNGLPKNTTITHINNLPVEALLATLLEYISSDTPSIASSLLEFQLPHYLWLLDQQRGALANTSTVTVVLNGKPRVVKVEHITLEALKAQVSANASDNDENNGKLRDYRMLSKRIAYLKPGPFYNVEQPSDVWNNKNYIEFIDQAFAYFLEQKADALVIDVRNNPGGTNSFSDPLISWFAAKPFRFASEFLIKSSKHAEASNKRRMDSSKDDDDTTSAQLARAYANNPYGSTFVFALDEALPRTDKQFKGRVYVLIDRSSYSNAVSLAAIVKDYGFGKVIGEPTVDFATTYASMETFTLKNSGIEVGFPKAHIIRPSGDKKAGPVYPDIVLVNTDFEAIVSAITKDK